MSSSDRPMRELFIENWILIALVLIAVIGLVLMLYVTDQGVSLGSEGVRVELGICKA